MLSRKECNSRVSVYGQHWLPNTNTAQYCSSAWFWLETGNPRCSLLKTECDMRASGWVGGRGVPKLSSKLSKTDVSSILHEYVLIRIQCVLLTFFIVVCKSWFTNTYGYWNGCGHICRKGLTPKVKRSKSLLLSWKCSAYFLVQRTDGCYQSSYEAISA